MHLLARDRAIFDLLLPDRPLTVEGAGADIWGSSDSFEFAEQYPNAKSLRVVSRVLSLDAANSFAKAGLMSRDGTAENAATVILDTRPDGNIEFMARLCAGCGVQFLGTAKVTLPAELILINDSITSRRPCRKRTARMRRRSGRLISHDTSHMAAAPLLGLDGWFGWRPIRMYR